MSSKLSLRPFALLLALICLGVGASAAEDSPYDPSWSSAAVGNRIVLLHDSQATPEQNGAALKAAVLQLQPGDQLIVGDGEYSVNSLFAISLQGTANAPIRIEGAPGQMPRLTRPNAQQNVVNLGPPNSGPARFLLLRNFEITGGSVGIRVEDCADVWIDACHIHHTGAEGIQASSQNTARLTITHCDIHHTSTVSGLGEGIYLGGNNASAVTRDAVVARNHIHDLMQGQGDGIDMKQGSFGCWIVENVIHDTNFPGIIAGGTGGQPRNRFERNLIWNTNTNAMQVQGEALVQNNIVFGGETIAFLSFDHQAPVRDLEVVNNTFVTTSGRAMKVEDWAGRPGMVLAGNALYSQSGEALFTVGNSLAGVSIEANVVHGDVVPSGLGGFTPGQGLQDFVDLAWDGSQRDAHPQVGGALPAAGASAWAPNQDYSGATRPDVAAAGAEEVGTYGRYVDLAIPGTSGEPRLTAVAYPSLASSTMVQLTQAAPQQISALFYRPAAGQAPGFGGRLLATTNATGRAQVSLDVPGQAALQGLTLEAFWLCRDPGTSGGLTRTQTVQWVLD